MKPRKRPLPASFREELEGTPVTLWGLRHHFERFYNAGLDESRDVLRDLYRMAADNMAFPPELLERIKDVLGNEPLATMKKPKFCAICTKPRPDLFQERLNGKESWVCTDCTVLSAGDPRYRFDDAPPRADNPQGARGRSAE